MHWLDRKIYSDEHFKEEETLFCIHVFIKPNI